MAKTRIRRTYSFKKLQRKFPKMVSDSINVIGSRLVKAIQDGIDKGVDVNGKKFEPLSENTKTLGGKKPLKRSGKMQKGIKKIPSNPNTLKFIIEMSAQSRGDIYGAFHNQGYTNSFKKKQWFKGATIPKREWFGIPHSMKPGGSELKKAIKLIAPMIARAWKKNGN